MIVITSGEPRPYVVAPSRLCEPCDGTGKKRDPWPHVRVCVACGGTGRKPVVEDTPTGRAAAGERREAYTQSETTHAGRATGLHR